MNTVRTACTLTRRRSPPQDIGKEAVKGLLVLALLETLFLTRPVSWLEDHVDYLSVQALLFQRASLSPFQKTRLFFSFRTRITD